MRNLTRYIIRDSFSIEQTIYLPETLVILYRLKGNNEIFFCPTFTNNIVGHYRTISIQ
jgi:hypothetical protein